MQIKKFCITLLLSASFTTNLYAQAQNYNYNYSGGTTTSTTNTNTNISTNASTSQSTSTNTNINQSTATSTNTNINQSSSTATNNNINTSTSTSTNKNYDESVSNSTINSSSNNVYTNTNVNQSTNYNNDVSQSTVNSNSNVNQNTNSVQKVESPPPTAIAPSIITNSSDLCTTGLTGAVQTQIFGLSAGSTVRDENCERLKLSKTMYDMGMKIAAVSLLCQDSRVFQAMETAGTPCPANGKIGKEAQEYWDSNQDKRPDKKKKK